MAHSETIGFITGGQLGQMMIQAFLPFRQSQKIWVLDSDANCPSASLADKMVLGSCSNYQDVINFGENCNVLVLEFEHVNIKALKELEERGVRIITDIRSLEIIQDKGKQKKFLQKNNIPTAKFFEVKKAKDIAPLADGFNFPVMQKTCADGYDGGGVKKINDESELSGAFDAPSIIEKCVDIQREFALIIGRDLYGETFSYPLVEQFFHEETHIVEFVVSPVVVSDRITDQVDEIKEKILENFTGVGIWAVELFEDEAGKILVNEIAPRVHNSGHQTIEGNYTSQFAQCMRLALGYKYGKTDILKPAIMWNLLGSEKASGRVFYEGLSDTMAMDDVYVHLYGKAITRPHRKMGHVTVVGDCIDDCWVKIKEVQKILKVSSI